MEAGLVIIRSQTPDQPFLELLQKKVNMGICNIQDILTLVENPSRYLGTEINRVKKDLDAVKLRMALAFPDIYEIGTSHFGIQILYNLLNRHSDIAAERVFAPGLDFEKQLRRTHTPLPSLESQAPLQNFDIIGFSLLYELNYTNILTILELSNIPYRAADRDENAPLIIAGGPCTCNPEPVADFFDAMVIGDGESVILQMAEAWIDWKDRERPQKDDLLKIWADIEGVYIPSFFKPRYKNDQQILIPQYSDYATVERAVVRDLNRVFFPEKPIVPYGRPVHDRLRLEIARGCTRGCRFCQAGMIYRPVRERRLNDILEIAERSLESTGYGDVSLLSLSTGDYACVVQLIQHLMQRCQSEQVAISLPSLRAGTLTPEITDLIKKVRKTGFTIAPEAGSQRLRDVINKNISEEEIFKTVTNAFDSGWSVIKLYFMVGLPTVKEEDVLEIVELAHRLKKIKVTGRRRGQINVSAATFIPKPHTPFQWCRQISIEESKSKIFGLKDRFKKLKGVQYKWQKPETSVLEGIFARGDRRLSRLVEIAYRKGCKFDGWTDHFRYDLWQNAYHELGFDVQQVYLRQRGSDEVLPWDHIDSKVNKAFLWSEWEKAESGHDTGDCRFGECNLCGVCDFETIEPIVFNGDEPALEPPTGYDEEKEEAWQKVIIRYSKREQARFFGHLEFANMVLRAIKRAGLPIRYTEGFHPKPKIQFDDPLPIGIESESEIFFLTLPVSFDPVSVPDLINSHLPDGIQILDCKTDFNKRAGRQRKIESYRITSEHFPADDRILQSFLKTENFPVTRNRSKGRAKVVDLRPAVKRIERTGATTLQMDLVKTPQLTVRPPEILQTVIGLTEGQVRTARIVKKDRS